MKISNFVKRCLDSGGMIKPLLIDPQLTNGTGLMNPSIYIDGNQLRINIRHVNYTLFHSEEKKFHHFWGPLQYVHPENDCTLTTVNYFGELSKDLDLINIQKIDTSQFDVKPLWEFVGLEDARVFRWDGKLYTSGVRRDTTTNGVGRMELCEIELTNNSVKEISRWRIPAPGKDNTYCEKNWMPIIDKPYHYIKWSNPTEVVKVDPIKKTCVTVHLEEQRYIDGLCDFRGGSQVISWNGYYLAVIHEVRLFNSELGRKDGKYFHRFVLWDQNFNIVAFSELFDFMGGDIEFCCGLAFYENHFLVTFGFQDNAAFILKFPEKIMHELLNISKIEDEEQEKQPIPVIGTAIVNGVHWLKRLINSVDYPVNEFVIFNNNGRDQITEELNNIANSTHDFIKKITVCHLPSNLGCGTAWNLIIKSYINSPYWIIVNHDVAFTDGFLDRMVKLSKDPEVGIVHATNGEWNIGSWEIFLIKDFVIQKYGLFDENLYPAYEEDMDYFMRLLADDNSLKRIISVGVPFLHGEGNNHQHGDIENYDKHGSQTKILEPELASKINFAQYLNQSEYMDNKWSKSWRWCNPCKHPFENEHLPLSYTTYDIDFIRKKYVGF